MYSCVTFIDHPESSSSFVTLLYSHLSHRTCHLFQRATLLFLSLPCRAASLVTPVALLPTSRRLSHCLPPFSSCISCCACCLSGRASLIALVASLVTPLLSCRRLLSCCATVSLIVHPLGCVSPVVLVASYLIMLPLSLCLRLSHCASSLVASLSLRLSPLLSFRLSRHADWLLHCCLSCHAAVSLIAPRLHCVSRPPLSSQLLSHRAPASPLFTLLSGSTYGGMPSEERKGRKSLVLFTAQEFEHGESGLDFQRVQIWNYRSQEPKKNYGGHPLQPLLQNPERAHIMFTGVV